MTKITRHIGVLALSLASLVLPNYKNLGAANLEEKGIYQELYCSGFYNALECNMLENQNTCFWNYANDLCTSKSLLPQEKPLESSKFTLKARETKILNLVGYPGFFIEVEKISETALQFLFGKKNFVDITTLCGRYEFSSDDLDEKKDICNNKKVILTITKLNSDSVEFYLSVSQ